MTTIALSKDNLNDLTLTVGDIKVTARRRHYTERNIDKATRVYGAIDALSSPGLLAEQERWTSPAVTAEMQRNDPDEAKRIMKGYRKATRALTTDVTAKLNELLTTVGELLNDRPRTPQVKRFSVYAGCSCPCSPGFVLDDTVRVDYRPVDLFVQRVADDAE
jgi:hypothetical protein